MDERTNYAAHCQDCRWFSVVPRNDEAGERLMTYVREHAEGEGHEVLVPFKIYERKGR
jgi:hypothetical protein